MRASRLKPAPSGAAVASRAAILLAPAGAVALLTTAGAAVAAEDPAIRAEYGVEATTAALMQGHAYWDIVNTLIPIANADRNYGYGEGFAKPRIALTLPAGEAACVHARASGVFSFTLGEDIFGTRNVGRLGVDELNAGVSLGDADGFHADISGGRMVKSYGTGGLIGDGAADGSRTGAILLSPYKAWALAGTIRLGYGKANAEVFYLDANEISTPDTETKIAGLNLQYDIAKGQFAGLTMGEVVHSLFDYRRATPDGGGFILIPHGRQGMRFANAYLKLKPFAAQPGFTLSADVVHQWHRSLDMNAWLFRGRVANQFSAAPLKPTLSYSLIYASGDNGSTEALESYDGLFTSGDDWAVGTSASQFLANSNLTVHRFQLDLQPASTDIIALKYFNIRVNELNSPFQVKPDTGIVLPDFGAITDKQFSHELGMEYTHIFSPAFVAVASLYCSVPGGGLESFAGGELKNWMVAGLMLRFSF